jgi:hypothetical protein
MKEQYNPKKGDGKQGGVLGRWVGCPLLEGGRGPPYGKGMRMEFAAFCKTRVQLAET